MTMEMSECLSLAVLDTSGLASGSSIPKRPESLALATPLPPKLEDSAKPVDTSSQASTADDTEMNEPTLEEIHATPSPPVGTPGPGSDTPPLDMTHLQEEANKALGDLLPTRSSIDAHWQKLVSHFGMALCQNESETTKAIKEAKATVPMPSRMQRPTAPQPSERQRLGEPHRPYSIQQSHTKDIQCLEEEAIEDKRRGHLTFLTTCHTALRASPPEVCRIMVAPFHLLLGHAAVPNL